MVEEEAISIKAESPTTAQEPEIPDAGEEEEEPVPAEEPDVAMETAVASPEPEAEAEESMEAEPEPARESKWLVALIQMVLMQLSLGKRKASETSQSGPRKRAREDSEATEEEVPSMSPLITTYRPHFIPISLLSYFCQAQAKQLNTVAKALTPTPPSSPKSSKTSLACSTARSPNTATATSSTTPSKSLKLPTTTISSSGRWTSRRSSRE